MDKTFEQVKLENLELRRARQCRLCEAAEIEVVFLPCGHAYVCQLCATQLSLCPKVECGHSIERKITIAK